MAYAFMRTMVQTRSKGHTATGAVCYRKGLAAKSTIPGADGGPRCFDYTRRTGIAATGWAAPPGTDPSWGDPITWAHRVEAVDKRKNSRQCRDDVVGIPVELVEAGVAEEVVQAYADRLAREHKTVVHFAVHEPDRGGKNHHAHVLYPGRHVDGLTFARKRDRTQDNPGKGGGPDLIAQHKAIWSELCRGRGLELDWTSETPGHHLGPALCAIKRDRLVEETRETIRETVAASTPGKTVPGERTLQTVAEIATRVNDGLTVTEMLEREKQEARHGRPPPRPVASPVPFQPEVLPSARAAPEVLPPARTVPEVLPPRRRAPEVLPSVKRVPEVLPPARTVPDVLPPARAPQALPPARAPQVLPPARTPQALPPVRRPEVLPPSRPPAEVSPPEPVAIEMTAARIQEKHPRETAATLSVAERYLELQRQTQANAFARAVMRKLREDAEKREREDAEKRGRERSKAPSAPVSRIRQLVDWALHCARQVLERLGLMTAAAPEREASQPPRRPEAAPPAPPPQLRPEPTLWERYQARWPRHAAADRALFEDLTEKPLPAALGHPVHGIDVWRRVLSGRFEGDGFHVGPVVPKPLPRSLAPAGQAGPGAAVHAADYAGSLPRWYRADFDRERIVERSDAAAEDARQTWRYRFTGEERKQALEDDAVRQACGDDAQRLDREMRADRARWQRHWDVLVRHDTLMCEEREQRELQRNRERLQEPVARSRTTRDRDRGPELTR